VSDRETDKVTTATEAFEACWWHARTVLPDAVASGDLMPLLEGLRAAREAAWALVAAGGTPPAPEITALEMLTKKTEAASDGIAALERVSLKQFAGRGEKPRATADTASQRRGSDRLSKRLSSLLAQVPRPRPMSD
jgi:hypothetical protein